MKISEQIRHEAETIINISKLVNPNDRDIAQLKGCLRRLKELIPLFEMDYDTLCKISEC